jgi:hypothetical protein
MMKVCVVALFIGVCHAGDFPDGLSEPLNKLAQHMSHIRGSFVQSEPLTIHLEEPRKESEAEFRKAVREVMDRQTQQMQELAATQKASFVAAGDANPVQDIMDQYLTIAKTLSQQHASFSQAADPQMLEVRLSAPKTASWDPLLSGLVQKREALESHYLALFRKALASKGSFLQSSASTPLNFEVEPLKQPPQDLLNLVVESEQKLNDAERAAFESALAQVQETRDSHVLAESDDAVELKFGEGSRPFTTFYDAVRKMELARSAAEDRAREELLGMISK